MKNFYSTIEDNIIKEHYSKENGSKIIMELLPDRDYWSIRSRANNLGLHRRVDYIKDEQFFDIPNTINSSFAGIIASDGHIQHRLDKRGCEVCRIVMNIHEKDEILLNDIIKALKANIKILKGKTRYKFAKRSNKNEFYEGVTPIASLQIGHVKKYIQILNDIWNIPSGSKKLIIKPPEKLIGLDVKLAYICGLITGDGTIGLTYNKKRKQTRFYMNCLGTKELMEWIKSVYEEYLGEKLKLKVHKEGNIFRFIISGIKAMILFEKIRSLNCIRLARKWDDIEVLNYIKEQKLKNPERFGRFLNIIP